MMDAQTAERAAIVARILSAEPLTEQLVACITPDLLRVADGHWVLPLLAHRLRECGAEGRVDARVADELRQQLCFEAAFELAVTSEIRRITDECARRRIPGFLMKGAALAYTHYPSPHLRPRLDTDLLVHARDRERVSALLESLGYSRSPATAGTVTIHQAQFVRQIAGGLPHAIDLHWKIVNPVVFSDVLTVDDIEARSVPVRQIAASARAFGPVHALVLLAVHRVAHHEPQLNLLGLYDIHLVAGRLTRAEWAEAMSLVEERGLAEVTAHALAAAVALYATPLPPETGRWMVSRAARSLPAAVVPFMREGRRVLDVIASDFRAARGWRRAQVLREHLLPAPSYMRARYGVEQDWMLPYLYVRRAVGGVPRVLRRGRFR